MWRRDPRLLESSLSFSSVPSYTVRFFLPARLVRLCTAVSSESLHAVAVGAVRLVPLAYSSDEACQRLSQAKQLCDFIARMVPPSAPLILAADLNLSVPFGADGKGRAEPASVRFAEDLLGMLHRRHALSEATTLVRGGQGSGKRQHSWTRCLRPTFGYDVNGVGEQVHTACVYVCMCASSLLAWK